MNKKSRRYRIDSQVRFFCFHGTITHFWSPRFSASWDKLSETRFGLPRHFTAKLSWLLRFTKPFGEARDHSLAATPFTKFYNKFYSRKNVILVNLIKDLVNFKRIFVKYTNSMQWLGFKSRFADSDTFFCTEIFLIPRLLLPYYWPIWDAPHTTCVQV